MILTRQMHTKDLLYNSNYYQRYGKMCKINNDKMFLGAIFFYFTVTQVNVANLSTFGVYANPVCFRLRYPRGKNIRIFFFVFNTLPCIIPE